MKSSTSTTASNQTKQEKTSEFLCKLKFSNTLPDLPFDPKCLDFEFDQDRFIRYQATSLERHYKPVLHTESDLGIKIDLIDQTKYLPGNQGETSKKTKYL